MYTGIHSDASTESVTITNVYSSLPQYSEYIEIIIQLLYIVHTYIQIYSLDQNQCIRIIYYFAI